MHPGQMGLALNVSQAHGNGVGFGTGEQGAILSERGEEKYLRDRYH